MAYRSRDFAAALEFDRAALRLNGGRRSRIVSLLGAARAAVECYELEAAVSHAREARDLAREVRHPVFEARAEYLLRAALYRVGRAAVGGGGPTSPPGEPIPGWASGKLDANGELLPDADLIDAVAHVDDAVSLAMLLLVEAAAAWRRRDLAPRRTRRTARRDGVAATGGAPRRGSRRSVG